MNPPANKTYELTDAMRPNLRKQAYWIACSRSWLDSVCPSEAREWLAGPKEELLRLLDQKAWGLMLATSGTGMGPSEWADALREVNPMWEDSAEPEEIDREDKNPLTKAERDRLEAIVETAHED